MRTKSIYAVVFICTMLLAFGVYAAGYGSDAQSSSSTRSSDMQSDTSTRGADAQSSAPATSSDMQSDDATRGAKSTAATTQARKIDRASKIIGMSVKNPQGDKLGDIKEIAIDEKAGSIAYAVLGAGGALGIGEKYFAIPWKSLSLNADGDAFVLNMDKDRLKNAPGFDKNNWPDFANQQWGAEVHKYYGQQPYWEGQSAR